MLERPICQQGQIMRMLPLTMEVVTPNLSIVEPDREDEDGDNESHRMLKMIMKKMKEMLNKP
jgi:hypothetical protein